MVLTTKRSIKDSYQTDVILKQMKISKYVLNTVFDESDFSICLNGSQAAVSQIKKKVLKIFVSSFI